MVCAPVAASARAARPRGGRAAARRDRSLGLRRLSDRRAQADGIDDAPFLPRQPALSLTMPRYRPRDHAATKLADRAKPKLKKAFGASLHHLRASVPVKEIAAILHKGGRRSAIERAIDFVHIKEVWSDAFDEAARVFEAGGKLGAQQITAAFKSAKIKPRYGRFQHFGRWRRNSQRPIVVRKDVGDEYAFDRFDPGTQQKLRDYQDQLIAELEQQARDTIEAQVL